MERAKGMLAQWLRLINTTNQPSQIGRGLLEGRAASLLYPHLMARK
mgnify:CR=1 FL=1|jgi:hypothetical protein